MKTKIMLIVLVSNVSLIANTQEKTKKYTIKALKISSHVIELLTGTAIAGIAIAALPKSHWLACGLSEQIEEKDPTAIVIYTTAILTSTTLIANSMRGLHQELYPEKISYNFIEKIKQLFTKE